MTLGQRVCLMVETFVINNAMIFIGLFLLLVAAADFYYRYLHINLNTDNIDLMDIWARLQLKRRYKL